MPPTVGARGTAKVVALAMLALRAGSGAADASAVKVLVAGKAVEANARTDAGTILGDAIAVLRALGAQVSYANQGLRGTTFCGEALQADVGETSITVGGRVLPLSAPLQDEGGRLTGPIADIATAVGCRGWRPNGGDELRIAPRLAQVEAHAADEGALVQLRVTGPAQAQLKRLREPSRAYVDLVGVTWSGRSEAIQVGGTGGLNRVRWALFREWPPVTRVVFDLAPGAQARMLEAKDGLFVVTTLPGTGAPSAAQSGNLHQTPNGRRLEAGATTSETGSGASLEGVHVVLDPAAGGDDAGSRGASVVEKVVTLDIATRAAVGLMDAGALVTLTRDADRTVSAQERAALIGSLAPDVVVRIACGASDDAAQRGIETRYGSQRAAGLGAALQRALVKRTGAQDRGAMQSRQCLVSGNAAAECIVGYLTSPTEGELLATPEYREKIAQGIAEGIADAIAAP
jgi:N-acetylmuramoyl-L-alanine amidase